MVYQVVKMLPKSEQRILFGMLEKEQQAKKLPKLKAKKNIITRDEAIQYLLKNVF